ncbi:hypothetical protein [Acinetobacter sp. SH20PTE14]|uniref:hypothetical protein n=1 Tax=Acinetobacter sp. SH20PTE14 TaxID=2905879 RepID=UPI001F2413DA|nr:hypothetical protein [Acinetobacter sp. SH20PTE14]UIJ74339.1 hypothetical protein LXF01_08680 [Acinetobacter sp. SH20PTE14]UIJ74346.1 hypothetical protein LXF01_08720 [Acinetobacter sp. SH20PTE14]
MTFKNVEVIEQQAHEKSWFQKFRSKFSSRAASTALVATGAAVALPAHAEGEIPDFLAGATSSLSGIAVSLGGVFLLAIGIILVIIAFTNSKGGLKRAG